MKKILLAVLLLISTIGSSQKMDIKKVHINGNFSLPSVIEPIDYDDFMKFKTMAGEYIPVKDEEFIEHVRSELTSNEEKKIKSSFESKSSTIKKSKYSKLVEASITSILETNKKVWLGTKNGLYHYDLNSKKITKQESYGIDGPLATNISDIVMDSKGNIWIGTPIGLSIYRGGQGSGGLSDGHRHHESTSPSIPNGYVIITGCQRVECCGCLEVGAIDGHIQGAPLLGNCRAGGGHRGTGPA